MKSISIAMATYNGSRFIGEQLESLARQTVLPSELVITDDGSTDNTLDIIAAFAATAPFPVHVWKNMEKLGYGGNFMKAASKCRFDLVAFCDQDDVWEPRKLEICRTMFANPDVVMAYHNAMVVTQALEPVELLACNAAPQTINPPMSLDPWRNMVKGFTAIVDRGLIAFDEQWQQSIDFYHAKERETHDQWFYFLATCLGSIAYIDDSLALYRQHESNVMGHGNIPGIRTKLRLLLTNEMDGLKSREIGAGRRAAMLEQIQNKVGDLHRSRAVAAALGYRHLEASYRARLEMYSAGNIFSRLRRLLALSRSGGYRPKHQWGAGRQALLRDIVRGVIFPTPKRKGLRSFSRRKRKVETGPSRIVANRASKRQNRS